MRQQHPLPKCTHCATQAHDVCAARPAARLRLAPNNLRNSSTSAGTTNVRQTRDKRATNAQQTREHSPCKDLGRTARETHAANHDLKMATESSNSAAAEVPLRWAWADLPAACQIAPRRPRQRKCWQRPCLGHGVLLRRRSGPQSSIKSAAKVRPSNWHRRAS